MLETVLVTGGAGFIGSNFIRHILGQSEFHGKVVNIDSLSYAGNPMSLADVQSTHGGGRYVFEKIDIRDFAALRSVIERHAVDTITHFAAESHVDRSIFGPKEFVETNVVGTFNMLESVRSLWAGRKDVRFHHVSTDEVYGSLGDTGLFTEETPYDPRSPYSATKAASDHLVRAYQHTYGLPATISNCSNNYGPYQFPEKMIPVMILNALEGKPLPIYGDGSNVRDWLHVGDHCEAIWSILRNGKDGETYNVGGECEKRNIEVVRTICSLLEAESPAASNKSLASVGVGSYEGLMTYVKDRPGHDRRYAIDCSKIKRELGWSPSVTFESGMLDTVRWYLSHTEWIAAVRSGEYRSWIEKNYSARGTASSCET